ncbi:MAG: protein-L-isoaspartate(D-aspartate) O-methyltransferase [Planctomycetota bacterium]|nr:MAG: protein-L-isoaspartate(D-aspartate) O-methyltransferase [Planctomycetota bacterium]
MSNADRRREREELCELLAARGVSDRRVLAAIRSVPRERFLPPELQPAAYDNNALAIGEDQTISQPLMVALMTQQLKLTGAETVLEVGTGSGYQAAILAELAARVVTIERLPGLAERAEKTLRELGYKNIEFRIGDGTLGCAEAAPFDGIIVTAGAPDVPAPLYRQLREGGRLVIPVGDQGLQILKTVTREPQGPVIEDAGGCRFVPLIGDAGWTRPE